MNFSDAASAAVTSLEGGSTSTPSATPAATPDTSSQTATQTPVTTPDPTQTPAGQQPAATPAQTFKVKENGQDVEVTLDELLSGHLRHRDYTQKTMSLADQRKQFESQVAASQQRESEIRDFLRDANQIKAYYQFLTNGQQLPTDQQIAQTPVQQVDPNAPVSVQQAQDLLAHQQRQVTQQLAQVQKQAQQEIAKIHQANYERMAGEMNTDVGNYINNLMAQEDLKILGAVDDIANVLSADAMRLMPKNIDEAKAAIKQVALARAEKMNAHYKEMLKQATVNQTQLATKGIEPPGGTGVTPTPTTFKLGDKGLSAAATAFLESQGKK